MTRASPSPSSATNSRRRASGVVVARGARDRRPAFRAVRPSMVDASGPGRLFTDGACILYICTNGAKCRGEAYRRPLGCDSQAQRHTLSYFTGAEFVRARETSQSAPAKAQIGVSLSLDPVGGAGQVSTHAIGKNRRMIELWLERPHSSCSV